MPFVCATRYVYCLALKLIIVDRGKCIDFLWFDENRVCAWAFNLRFILIALIKLSTSNFCYIKKGKKIIILKIDGYFNANHAGCLHCKKKYT